MPSSEYECTEASFGVVVTKKTAQVSGYTAATDYCTADGAMVHLPTPKSEAENLWYNDYMYSGGTKSYSSFWLGINDANVEGRGAKLLNIISITIQLTVKVYNT